MRVCAGCGIRTMGLRVRCEGRHGIEEGCRIFLRHFWRVFGWPGLHGIYVYKYGIYLRVDHAGFQIDSDSGLARASP